MKTKTPEEILYECGVSINHDGNDYMKYGATLNKIKEAMKAYASQLIMTDEEIIKMLKKQYQNGFLTLSDDLLNKMADGAKWYRDQIKKAIE